MGKASRRKRQDKQGQERARAVAAWLVEEYKSDEIDRLLNDVANRTGQFSDVIGYIVGCETLRIMFHAFGLKDITTHDIAMKLQEGLLTEVDDILADAGIDPDVEVPHSAAVALGIVAPDADDDTIPGFDDPSGETCPKCGQEVDRDEEHDWVHVYRSNDGRCVALGVTCAPSPKD